MLDTYKDYKGIKRKPFAACKETVRHSENKNPAQIGRVYGKAYVNALRFINKVLSCCAYSEGISSEDYFLSLMSSKEKGLVIS